MVLRHSVENCTITGSKQYNLLAPTIPTASGFGSDLAKVLVDITAVYYMASFSSEEKIKDEHGKTEDDTTTCMLGVLELTSLFSGPKSLAKSSMASSTSCKRRNGSEIESKLVLRPV